VARTEILDLFEKYVDPFRVTRAKASGLRILTRATPAA
jgi:hypothetical protein